ncbi:MAG: rRNA maturation RNase YbeY [Parasporobacterium sp.]|nr:rRNA maturation RNase YbeY [Parasporobacterium sp.]
MNIYIENETELTFDFDDYERAAREAVLSVASDKKLPEGLEVDILITDAEGIREINSAERGIDSATDVLSFPYFEYEEPGVFAEELLGIGEEILGEIVLCADKIISQAEEYGHSQKREFSFLIVHSMLHLLGYDHMEPSDAEIMQAEERRLMDILGISR